jgi:U3 small nucleolar RNA-associated protein 14
MVMILSTAKMMKKLRVMMRLSKVTRNVLQGYHSQRRYDVMKTFIYLIDLTLWSSQKMKARPSASATNVRFAEVDLDENEPERQFEEESQSGADSEGVSGDSGDFLDVLDVLDGRGEPDFGDEQEERMDKGKKSRSKQVEEHDSGGRDEDEDEDEDRDGMEEEEEMKDAFAPSDNEEQSDGEALDNLGAFVSKLDVGKKRKAEDDSGEAAVSDGVAPSRKRRTLKERTEAGVESEFGVHAASGGLFCPSLSCQHQVLIPLHIRIKVTA